MRIAVIPARGGSVRIPRKNIKLFHGKPIIAYSIETARASHLFDRIVVSTEDPEIASIAAGLGAEIVLRPSALAELNGAPDCGTQEVTRHALLALAAEGKDTACCLYATAPLLLPSDLHNAYAVMTLRPCSYVVSVALDPLRDAGQFYMGTAGGFIARQHQWNTWSGIYVIPPERAIDINEPEDWVKAEQMYAALHKGDPNGNSDRSE